MDEARRFLRYVVPGLVFQVQLLLCLMILLPVWTTKALSDLGGESSVAPALLALLASGGVGYLLSMIHHSLHWRSGGTTLDYRPLIARLRQTNRLVLINTSDFRAVSEDVVPDRFQAWVIVTAIWHERAKTSTMIRGADARATSMSDLTHSTGTAMVAIAGAWICTLGIALHVSTPTLDRWPVVRWCVMFHLALWMFWTCYGGYRRTSRATQALVEQILDDALSMENLRRGDAVQTRVWLQRPS